MLCVSSKTNSHAIVGLQRDKMANTDACWANDDLETVEHTAYVGLDTQRYVLDYLIRLYVV